MTKLGVFIAAVLCDLSCARAPATFGKTNADPPRTQPAPIAPMVSWQSVGMDDRRFGPGAEGQLARIDWLTRAPLPPELQSLWRDSESRRSDIATLIRDDGRSSDPRTYMAIAGAAVMRAVEDGPVRYGMLTKNASVFVGRPWLLVDARLSDIHESGGLTVGRVEMEPGRDLAFACHCTTPFIDGDRVDMAGYFGGERAFGARTTPLFAAAFIANSGTVSKVNKIMGLWKAEIGRVTLASLPRAK